MSFTSALTNLIISAGVRKSWLQQLLDNTKFNNDRIDGDNAESTGAGGHDHTASGEGSLIPFAAVTAGIDCSDSESDTESDTNLSSFQQKLIHNFTPPVAGNYIIMYNFEITNANNNGETDVQIDLDAGTIIGFTHEQPVDANDYQLHSGFAHKDLTAAAHTIEVDYKKVAGGNAKIRRVRVVTWRCI